MGHKHFMEMRLYAMDAAESETPWDRWQVRNDEVDWTDMNGHPSWFPEFEYRRKPKTILINGFEVPVPVNEKLLSGTEYLMPDLTKGCKYKTATWWNDTTDERRLSHGLIHLTKEAAIKHAEALLSFTRQDKQD